MIVLEYHVINSVPRFPSIYWVSNMYPTVTGATDRCMIPLLILPGCPLQEPFTGIDDDMNSTEAWLLRRLLIEARRFYSHESWMEGWETKKPTSCHFWMHGLHVEHFELCREHFLTGNPGAVRYIHQFSTCIKFSKIGTRPVLHTAYNVARLHAKKGRLATPGTRDLQKSWILGALPIHYRPAYFLFIGYLVTSFTTVSFGYIFHPRFWDATCADVMRKSREKTNHKLPWNRNELWRCGGEIHVLVKIFSASVWVCVADTHERFMLILQLVWAQGLAIDQHKDSRALLFSWTTFGHPAACLVWVSRKLDAGGSKRYCSHYNGRIVSHLSGIWIQSL